MFRYIRTLLALVLTLVLAGCGDDQGQVTNGKPAPGFRLEHLDKGQRTFPDDFSGKVVAVRFWADWCPFCDTEMRAIEPVYQKYKEQGLVILAINVRQERPTVEWFIEQLNISYDTLLDAEGEAAKKYGVLGLPTTFIVDRKGVLHSRIIGESTPETFEKIVKELL